MKRPRLKSMLRQRIAPDMKTIRLLLVIEASTVTGPAKNVLAFLRVLESPAFQENGRKALDCSIVTFHRRNASGTNVSGWSHNNFVAAARAQGIEVDVIEERHAFDPAVLGQLRKIVFRRKPDLLQTHMVKSHFLTKLTGVVKAYPWIAYHHGYTTTDLKTRAYNQLNRWSLPSAARVITVCQAFADQLARARVCADRIAVCHNSVVPPILRSPQARSTLRRQLGINEGDKVIVSIGRLSREKGHPDLITAMEILGRTSPGSKPQLLIVGDGPERPTLEKVAQTKGLSEQIVFVGHTDDVHKYYAVADIFALPSHSEGSPNVLLEAMSAGLPVVATAVGGIPEIAISGKNSLLVAAHNPGTFAQALARLLRNESIAQELGASARRHVQTSFSPEKQARSLLETYQQVLSPSSKHKKHQFA